MPHGRMQVKLFEVRDKATFVPVICVGGARPPRGRMNESEDYLIGRLGWVVGSGFVYMTVPNRDRTLDDPRKWGDRTYKTAHTYIQAYWNELESGAVIDVEHILGEKDEPKISERFTEWPTLS